MSGRERYREYEKSVNGALAEFAFNRGNAAPPLCLTNLGVPIGVVGAPFGVMPFGLQVPALASTTTTVIPPITTAPMGQRPIAFVQHALPRSNNVEVVVSGPDGDWSFRCAVGDELKIRLDDRWINTYTVCVTDVTIDVDPRGGCIYKNGRIVPRHVTIVMRNGSCTVSAGETVTYGPTNGSWTASMQVPQLHRRFSFPSPDCMLRNMRGDVLYSP